MPVWGEVTGNSDGAGQSAHRQVPLLCRVGAALSAGPQAASLLPDLYQMGSSGHITQASLCLSVLFCIYVFIENLLWGRHWTLSRGQTRELDQQLWDGVLVLQQLTNLIRVTHP